MCLQPLLRAGRVPVCDRCLHGLQASPFAACCLCGEALAMESARAAGLSRTDGPRCETCTLEPPAFHRAVAFGDYGGSLRTLLHLHKFDGVRSLAVPLGERLADAMARVCDGVEGTLHVVAVPLYRHKRAFNQSELMAEAAMRVLRRTRPGLALRGSHGLLRRTRRTESQAHLTPRQRRTNVLGAFAVVGDVRGLDILLVDDVYTTGATVAECTRALLQAGAASVRVATLARTQQDLAAVWDAVPARNIAGWDL